MSNPITITSAPATAATYTVAQIATALGRSRRQMAFALLPAAGLDRAPNGAARRVWTLAELPEEVRTALQLRASRGRYRTIDDLLAHPPAPWKSSVPLAECSERNQLRARQLKEALRDSIVRAEDTSLPEAEFVRKGLADYARVVGEILSERRWRDLFKRTCERAGALAEFDRDEIYLDEKPARRPELISKADAVAPDCAALRERIRKIMGREIPTPAKRAQLWDAIFLDNDRRLEGGAKPKAARRALVAFIASEVPALVRKGSSNAQHAIATNFKRKHAAWLSSGRSLNALDDGRVNPERDLPYNFSADEWTQVSMQAAGKDNLNLGWRKFLASDHARLETKRHFGFQHKMPAWIRKLISHDVTTLQPCLRGPRTARDRGAFISREPSTLLAGDSDQSDDLTLDLYWYDETPAGVWFGQGQLLPWIDERSWMIYSLCLIADANYTGFDIRNSWTEKVRKHGLPRKRVHVERGRWEDASVWNGRKLRGGDEEVGTAHAEDGIRRLGIDLRNATTPRGKLIERLFGSLNDLLRGLPGFCGSNQRVTAPEALQKKVRQAQNFAAGRGGEHPRELGFWNKSQVMAQLQEIAHELNNTTKRGKYHTAWVGNKQVHLTPTQAYEHFFGTERLTSIPPEFEHLFARNRMVRLVGRNGVRITHGRRVFVYKNDALGCFKGREMACWFNPEDPSILQVTGLDGRDRFAVPQEIRLSHNATAEEIAAAHAVNAGFDAHRKDMHQALKPAFSEAFTKIRFRHTLIDSATIADAQDLRVSEAEIKAERKVRVRVNTAARNTGMTISPDVPVESGDLDRLARARRFLNADSQGSPIP